MAKVATSNLIQDFESDDLALDDRRSTFHFDPGSDTREVEMDGVTNKRVLQLSVLPPVLRMVPAQSPHNDVLSTVRFTERVM